MDKVFLVADSLKPHNSGVLRTKLLQNGIKPATIRIMDWKDTVGILPEGSYVLVLGAAALEAVLPVRVLLSDVRGRWWRLPSGQWAMASYHPGVVSYSPTHEALLLQDLEKFMGSVLLQDLKRPVVSDYCVKCTRYATFFINKLGFCQAHAPRQRKVKTWNQLSLDI